ncbi:MAG: type IV secretory system conjugative DNA transfer family protein [Firmicutes bacterium]|nr:type IV secretory system conjugative DNA transfer family protein [Bacillota bacterium]
MALWIFFWIWWTFLIGAADVSSTVGLAKIPALGLFAVLTVGAIWLRTAYPFALLWITAVALSAEFSIAAAIFFVLASLILGVLWHRTAAHGTVLGYRWAYPFIPVHLSLSDRFLHMHVIGPTGSGKSSSVLFPLIRQDLKAHRGLTLIEPKGDLSAAVYRQARLEGATIIFFDPQSADCPHYNPLDGPADAAAEGLSWSLNQLSEAGHPFYATAGRILLLYSVFAVKEAWGSQADLSRLLDFLRTDTQRDHVLSRITSAETLRYFHDQIQRLGPKSAQEQRQGLLNRLELLQANPAVRRVLSGPGDFTWDDVLRQGYVVISPLSPAYLGESARSLGVLLWHGLMMATYRRPLPSTADQPPLAPYFLFLDEFHQYVTPDLSDFLALARGYSVGLTLAHQDMGQLSPALSHALLANARQRLLLSGLSIDDSALLDRLSAPSILSPRLRYGPRGIAAAQLTRHGQIRPPFFLRLAYYALDKKVH